jgi:hypothetical protein
MSHASKAWRVALFTTLLGALASGCDGDKPPLAIVSSPESAGCLVNSDCEAPLVCAFQRCHVECVTTRDCDGTLRCVGAHEASRVCQLEVEAKCKSAVDCAQGFICSQDGACRDVCTQDSECVDDQKCVKGACAEPSELDEDGGLPQVLDFESCTADADCGAGARCVAHNCVPQCREDRDCAPGGHCQDGSCQTPPAECSVAADCGKAGQVCAAGKCQCQCQEDVDCAAGETCDGCGCVAAPAPECTGDLDCGAGKRCISEHCACECHEDRDCALGRACDGCGCHAVGAPTSVHDVTIRSALDIQDMQGIQDVETSMVFLGGQLTTTRGLESLRSVGSLDFNQSYALGQDPDEPDPLVGLANLILIRGDLSIYSSQISKLTFNPELVIQGNVSIFYSQVLCDEAFRFETALRAKGFTGTFSAKQLPPGCPGTCVAGQCT